MFVVTVDRLFIITHGMNDEPNDERVDSRTLEAADALAVGAKK